MVRVRVGVIRDRIMVRVMFRVRVRIKVRVSVKVRVRVRVRVRMMVTRVKKGRQSLHPRFVLKDHLWSGERASGQGLRRAWRQS
jgi:hypothetical protein